MLGGGQSREGGKGDPELQLSPDDNWMLLYVAPSALGLEDPQLDSVCTAGNIHLLTPLLFSPPLALYQLLFECLLIFLSWLWFSCYPLKSFKRLALITTPLFLQPSPALAPHIIRGKYPFHHANEQVSSAACRGAEPSRAALAKERSDKRAALRAKLRVVLAWEHIQF